MASTEDEETYVAGHDLELDGHRQSVNPPDAGPSENRVYHTSAPKRMANGDIKSPGYSPPTIPGCSSQYGHSRNSSRTSRGSQVGEVRR